MKSKEHIIKSVEAGSIAQEMEIEAGDRLLKINGEEIGDIFDYQYLVQDEYIEVLVGKPDGCWRLIRSLARIWGLYLKTA